MTALENSNSNVVLCK